MSTLPFKKSFFGLALLGCGAAAMAAVENLPSRKPGLWELTLQTDSQPTVTMNQCIDAKTDASMQKAGRGVMAGSCTKEVMRREGAGYVSESVCSLGGSTITSRGVVTGDFNSEVKMVVDAQYAPPLMGVAKAKTTVTQRWKSACPAGWKPGDMEMPGMKQRININDIPAMAPKR